MMRSRLFGPVLALPLALALAGPVAADTLADIRVELGQLAAEFNKLKSELTTTGASARMGGSDALARMDSLEAEMMRLTARTEEIELRLNRVVSDGTNKIGDIEFRLCEATEGCDPMDLGKTSVLGGGSAGSSSGSAKATPAPAAAAPKAASNSGPELAVSEKADFDRAKEVLGQGDFPGAAALFATYAQSYPGGPLVPEAQYLRGEALRQSGQTAPAARAYLDAYSSDPKGTFAADSVLKLGEALGQLGQTQQACVTLAQVAIDYPDSAAASQAPASMQALGCN